MLGLFFSSIWAGGQPLSIVLLLIFWNSSPQDTTASHFTLWFNTYREFVMWQELFYEHLGPFYREETKRVNNFRKNHTTCGDSDSWSLAPRSLMV